jgi:serine/threonine protein kinase
VADVLIARRYRLESRLGGGGMGDVWRARDEFLGRVVAVKEVRLPSGLTAQQRAEFCERMMREARAAAALTHPSIITVHDVLEHDQRPWIVMDLINGPSLEQVRTSEGPLPPRRVAEIGIQLLDALTLAHRRGILHRDVKPANVLLTPAGQAVLTDFGIATIAGDERLTLTHGLVGSPGYMAPERLQQGRSVGPASDLWSLGATLYAAVEGRPAFERRTAMAVLGAVLTDQAPPPERAGPLGPLLLAMLAREPDHRPDPNLIRQGFQIVAGDVPTSTPTRHHSLPSPVHGVPTVPVVPARRPRRLLAVTAAAVVLVPVLAIGGYQLLPRDDTDAPSPPSTLPTSPGSASASTNASAAAAVAPDPCKLLTTADVAGLFDDEPPPPSPDDKTCSFGDLKIQVRFFTAQSAKTGPDLAKETYTLFRRQAVNDAGISGDPTIRVTTSPARAVPALGQEAFAQDKGSQGTQSNSLFTSAESKIIVRSGAVILTITYRLRGQPKVTPELKDVALRAARAATANLATTN